MPASHRHITFAEGDLDGVGRVCFFWIVHYGKSARDARRRAQLYRQSDLFEHHVSQYAQRLGVVKYRIHSRSYAIAVERGDTIEHELRLGELREQACGE